ncbi:DUF2220 domain-containing protein [Mesobacillus jeotgali]|uniref:DUF2220 domain-containing protein n=1 Tax=Mesobacillus jeotgali TaxID=129985 RepID=UPI002147DC75|nr:DUF2220 domain-containing protein [Mesobacillus jeotgali]
MLNSARTMLAVYKRKTIELSELEIMLPRMSYEQFAQTVLSLEEEGVIEMMKSKGRNTRNPSLAYVYRIHTTPLKQAHHADLLKHRILLHPSIQLDSYFSEEPSLWNHDSPYILKISSYIEEKGFPAYEVPAPERSVELIGDEKWITEKRGEELLKRIGLLAPMKIIPVADPLMFSLNPSAINRNKHLHLIVENKTTFQALEDALPKTVFTTLIYGCGNKIIKSIEQFDRQLPLSNKNHEFYYFGDIDRSGIFIWHKLNQKVPAKLYLPFYQACLSKDTLAGKTNQRYDQEAILEFLTYFSKGENLQLLTMLENGQYLPQEVLKTKELQEIWRQSHGIE